MQEARLVGAIGFVSRCGTGTPLFHTFPPLHSTPPSIMGCSITNSTYTPPELLGVAQLFPKEKLIASAQKSKSPANASRARCQSHGPAAYARVGDETHGDRACDGVARK